MGDIIPILLDFRETGGDSTFFDTNAYTPPINNTVVLVCNGIGLVSPPPIIPTVVGNGVSWSLVATQLYAHGGADRARLSVYRGLASSPTLGTTRVSYAATQFRQSITVFQFTQTDIGNLGANAIVGTPAKVEIAASSGFNPSLAVPVGEDPANSQVGFLGYSDPNPGITPGIGFVTLQNNPTIEGGGHYLEMSQIVLPAVDFNVTTEAPTFAIIAVELRNATPAAPGAAAQVSGRPAFLAGNLIN